MSHWLQTEVCGLYVNVIEGKKSGRENEEERKNRSRNRNKNRNRNRFEEEDGEGKGGKAIQLL